MYLDTAVRTDTASFPCVQPMATQGKDAVARMPAPGVTPTMIFLLFGGSDDRLALAFIEQLCMNPVVRAAVAQDGRAASTLGASAVTRQTTSVSTAFPDTVYAALDTRHGSC